MKTPEVINYSTPIFYRETKYTEILQILSYNQVTEMVSVRHYFNLYDIEPIHISKISPERLSTDPKRFTGPSENVEGEGDLILFATNYLVRRGMHKLINDDVSWAYRILSQTINMRYGASWGPRIKEEVAMLWKARGVK